MFDLDSVLTRDRTLASCRLVPGSSDSLPSNISCFFLSPFLVLSRLGVIFSGVRFCFSRVLKGDTPLEDSESFESSLTCPLFGSFSLRVSGCVDDPSLVSPLRPSSGTLPSRPA